MSNSSPNDSAFDPMETPFSLDGNPADFAQTDDEDEFLQAEPDEDKEAYEEVLGLKDVSEDDFFNEESPTAEPISEPIPEPETTPASPRQDSISNEGEQDFFSDQDRIPQMTPAQRREKARLAQEAILADLQKKQKKLTRELKRQLEDEEDAEDNVALDNIMVKKDIVDRLKSLPVWLTSLALHIALMVFLALHYLGDKPKQMEIVSQPTEQESLDIENLGRDELQPSDFEVETFETQPQPVETPDATMTDFDHFTELDAAEAFEFDTEMTTELVDPIQSVSMVSNGLAGRLTGKKQMLKSGGGTGESEAAVSLALDWLARHQRSDGSWSLKLENCQCGGKGSMNCPIAATSLALLPFLGAGHTPTKGTYSQVVAKGIDFLLANGTLGENGYDMTEQSGTMYSHGLATIVLCETYAMAGPTERAKYSKLGQAAQQAVRFIEYAQDPKGGGWRYQPQQQGDTSVVGWQLMALKSAGFGGLKVQPYVLGGVVNFLNYVSDDGITYGYLRPHMESTGSTNAIGLLCHLFLDWDLSHPALIAGVGNLSQKGPNFSDPYFIYYSTQLMHHFGGAIWKNWNAQVRDTLIRMQEKNGESTGSWEPDNSGPHVTAAGRLFVTSLFCMTLEVYYRHMPIYQLRGRRVEEDDFPLD